MNFLTKYFNKVFNKSVNECSICLSELSTNDFCKIKCGHMFHTSCIIRCNNKCPLCRATINTNIIENDNFTENENYVMEYKTKILNELIKNVNNEGDKDIVNLFVKYYNQKDYAGACKIKCIYQFGSIKYFQKKNINITEIDYDIIFKMDEILDNYVSDQLIEEIEDKVIKLMPSFLDSFDDGIDRSFILKL